MCADNSMNTKKRKKRRKPFYGVIWLLLFIFFCSKFFFEDGPTFFLCRSNFFSKHRPSGSMLSIRQNVHLRVCVSVRLSMCSLFAPTFRCWMSNIFRDSESLEKSNGKKWSQIGTFLFGNHAETMLPDGLETSGWRLYRLFWHISRHFWVVAFWIIFSVFLVHPETMLLDGLETSGRRAYR